MTSDNDPPAGFALTRRRVTDVDRAYRALATRDDLAVDTLPPHQASVFLNAPMQLPHLQPGPMCNALPSQCTPHVTLARRVVPGQLGRALWVAGKPGEIADTVVGLRRWDGNKKLEYPIG